MSSYLIFVDEAPIHEANGLLARHGLADIERGANRMTWLDCQEGPGGKRGVLGSWMDPEKVQIASFQPDKQKWVPLLIETGAIWLGTSIDDGLRPDDILRSAPFPHSIPCLLEDGNLWMIPVARSLPHILGQDAKGVPTRTPADPFVEFCAGAEEAFQFFATADKGGAMTGEVGWPFVCQALALNHRLAPPIISALRLVSDKACGRIVLATIEMQLIRDVEAEKKNME